ncbi:MAG: hypothetical protein IJD51_05505 [Clostridia bacterium]|nr:hypothetical protein [Clostridia bacterium]
MSVDTRSDWSFTTEEAALADAQSLRAEFKIKLDDCKRVVKLALGAAKTLEKTRKKAEAKRNSRNLTKLSRAQHECDSALNEALVERRNAKAILEKIAEVYDETAIHFMLAGKKGKSKKYTKICDKYVRCKEESLESVYAPISQLMSGSPTEEETRDAKAATPERPSHPSTPPAGAPPPFYFVPAYMDGSSSSSIKLEDVKAAVKEALEEQLAPFITQIEQKLEQIIAASLKAEPVELNDKVEATEDATVAAETETKEPSAEETAVAESAEPDEGAVLKCEEISDKARKLSELLDTVVSELDGVGEKIGTVLEAQRAVNDMQRTLAREMQGMQVKQKLVNEEQMALVESEELILQQQRLIGEKQAELAEAQAAAVQAVEAIMEAQSSVEESVKSSIQAQKGIIQSNAKNLDIQRELIDKQAEIAQLQKEAVSAQRKLSRRVKPQDPKTPPTDGGEDSDT